MAFSNSFNDTNPGSAVGNRESIADMVWMLEPENTPLTSLCSRGKASATYEEFVVDKLDDAEAPAIVEGADVSSFSDKFAGEAKLGNRCQIFEKNWMVSKTQEAVDSVGPARYARAKTKAYKELKRNVEFALASDNELAAENGAGQGGQLRGIGQWLESSADTGGAGVPTGVPSDYNTPAESISTAGTGITEDGFNTLLQSRFDQTGNAPNLTLVAGSALRRAVSNFFRSEGSTTSTVYNINENASSRKVTLSVKLFDSDFGFVSIVNGNPDCMPATDRGYVLDPKYLKLLELFPMRERPLADGGGGPRGMVECQLTLQIDPRSGCKIV